jgi:ribosomal protein S18 acetylase RimI-like enzyme
VRSWREGYRGLMPDELLDSLSVEERTERWQGWLAGDESDTIVALDAGVIVGFATTAWPEGRSAPPCEIAALYVEPARFRTGIGTLLLGAALAALRSSGRAEVTLWVLESNDAALAFYERFGFAADGAREPHDRTAQRMVRLRAPLSPA